MAALTALFLSFAATSLVARLSVNRGACKYIRDSRKDRSNFPTEIAASPSTASLIVYCIRGGTAFSWIKITFGFTRALTTHGHVLHLMEPLYELFQTYVSCILVAREYNWRRLCTYAPPHSCRNNFSCMHTCTKNLHFPVRVRESAKNVQRRSQDHTLLAYFRAVRQWSSLIPCLWLVEFEGVRKGAIVSKGLLGAFMPLVLERRNQCLECVAK